MNKLVFVSVMLASLNVFSASTAADPLIHHLEGSWTNGGEIWKFSSSSPAVTNELTEKMTDERGRAIQCRVQWQGELTVTICSEASRKAGFCYNKGRVAKYMLGTTFKSVTMVPAAANPASCVAAIERANAKASVTNPISLYALALAGTGEIWLTQKHLNRQ